MGAITTPVRTAVPAGTAFVGRAEELARLRALTAGLAMGQGGGTLIEGEAGIGKTRLLDEVAVDAGRSGYQLFRARAQEFDARRPFGAIVDCLRLVRTSPDPDAARLAELLLGEPASAGTGTRSEAVVGGGDGRAREMWLVDAVVRVVEDACARSPVMVVVDDLQWADPETLLVLHRLCRLVGELPLLVLGSCRPVPRSAALDRLRQSMGECVGPPLLLGPLPAADVVDLLAEVLRVAPGPRLSAQVVGAAGNPFFVLELVAALQTSGTLRVGPDGAEIDAVAFPPGLALAVLHRLSFLSDEVLDVVRIASILGSRFRVQDLAAALRQSVVELAPSLRQARQAGVLTDDAERIAFRHDLIREALYEDIPRPVRTGLHREVALSLVALGAPAVQVAEHFVRAESVGDPVAAEWVLRAANEVTTRSPNVASDLLGRAVDLFPPDDGRRDAVTADWLASLHASGRGHQAIEPCLEMLSRPLAPAIEVRLRLLLAQLYSGSGRQEEAMEQARLLVGVPGLSDAQRARSTGLAAQVWLSVPDFDVAEELAGRAMALASTAGDRVGCSVASTVRSLVALRRGRYQAALEEIAEAFVADDGRPLERMAHGTPHGNQVAAIVKALALMRLDRVEEAASALDAIRDEAERQGFRRLLGTVLHLIETNCFYRGDWEGAISAYQSLVEISEAWDLTAMLEPPELLVAAGARAVIAVHRGDLATARRLVGCLPVHGWVPGRLPDRAVALLAEADGYRDVAWAWLDHAWDQSAGYGAGIDFSSLGPELVRLAIAGGEGDELAKAGEVTEAVASVAATNPGVASVAGAAHYCRGLLASDPVMLVEARASFTAAKRPLEAAGATEEAAALLGGSDPVAGRALFERAIATYEDLDASWDVGRVLARMRELGLRRSQRGPQRRATSGWEALTPAERSVVELAAQGMSNPAIAQRLFVSRGTVKAHVASALAKLHMTSRLELVREVAGRSSGR